MATLGLNGLRGSGHGTLARWLSLGSLASCMRGEVAKARHGPLQIQAAVSSELRPRPAVGQQMLQQPADAARGGAAERQNMAARHSESRSGSQTAMFWLYVE